MTNLVVDGSIIDLSPLVSSPTATFNGIQVNGAASGSDPSIAVVGSDTNRNLVLTMLGTGTIKFGSTGPMVANGTVAATFTTTSAPTGASTAIQRWLTFIDSTGRAGFIPVF